MEKRGQVTIFIIIALVIVVSAVVIFVFRDKIGIFTTNSDPVYLFVTSCIQETGEDAIYFIAQNGGYLFPPTLSNSEGIPYYFYNNKDYTPTKDRISQEISYYLKNAIPSCTNKFANFSNVNITEGEIKVKTTIEDKKITLDVTYPLLIKQGESTKKLLNFNGVNIPVRVGTIYNSIKNMTQAQIGKSGICLNCISKIMNEEGLTIDIDNTNESIVFIITDEYSKIKEVPIKWRFANGY